MTGKLRSVSDGERPRRRKFATVADAARLGTRRDLLVAMRDRVADAVLDCPTKDLSPLTRRLQELDRDIAALDALDVEEPSQPINDMFDLGTI